MFIFKADGTPIRVRSIHARHTFAKESSFKVRLPSGASLQQVYLNDAVVQARDEEGMLSVLIPKNKTSTVKVDYEIQAEPISGWSDVNILLPHSDIKVPRKFAEV